MGTTEHTHNRPYIEIVDNAVAIIFLSRRRLIRRTTMGSASEAVRDMENASSRVGDKAYDKMKDASNAAKSGAQDMSNKAHDLYDQAGTAVKDFASKVSDTAEKGYRQLESSGRDAYGQAKEAVQSQPAYAVLAAAGLGLIAGLLLAGNRK